MEDLVGMLCDTRGFKYLGVFAVGVIIGLLF